jgi:hypothetical protein
MSNKSLSWYELNVKAKVLSWFKRLKENIRLAQKETLKWYVLNGKSMALNVLLLFGVFVFSKPILLTTKEYLQVTSDILTDVFVISISLAMLFWGWQFDIKSIGRFANRIVTTLIFVAYYVFILRETPELKPALFSQSEGFYYFDLIVISGAISWSLVPIIRFKYEERQIKKSLKVDNPNETETKDIKCFIEDIPTDNGDQLQRKAYAQTLAGKIMELKPKNAFNIGIFGEWGSGKSDFMHRIGKELRLKKNEEVIIVEFNPWRVGSNNSITEDYLQVLSRHLRPYSSRLSNSIGDYAKQFIDKADTTGIVKSASNILSDTFMPNVDIESQYEAVRNEVNYLNKVIVVFIDDLDRLNKEEILETFKLIRNVADFPNTFFVLGLDYDYVMKTAFEVEKINHSHNLSVFEPNEKEQYNKKYFERVLKRREIKKSTVTYIDKIFQVTVSLPYTSLDHSSLVNFNLLNDLIDQKGEKGITEDFLKKVLDRVENNPRIKIDIRSFKKIINLFKLKIKQINHQELDVDFGDLFLLTIIEVLDYRLYKLILDKSIPFYRNEFENFIDRNFNLSSTSQYSEVIKDIKYSLANEFPILELLFELIGLNPNENLHSFSNPEKFFVYTSLGGMSSLDIAQLSVLLRNDFNPNSIDDFIAAQSKNFSSQEKFLNTFRQFILGKSNPYLNISDPNTFLNSCFMLSYLEYDDFYILEYMISYLNFKHQQYDPSMVGRIIDWTNFLLDQEESPESLHLLECTSRIIIKFFRYNGEYSFSNDFDRVCLKLYYKLVDRKAEIKRIHYFSNYLIEGNKINSSLNNLDLQTVKTELKDIFIINENNFEFLLTLQFGAFDFVKNIISDDDFNAFWRYYEDLYSNFFVLRDHLERFRNKYPHNEIFEFSFNLIERTSSVRFIAKILTDEDRNFIKAQYEKNLIRNPKLQEYLW